MMKQSQIVLLLVKFELIVAKCNKSKYNISLQRSTTPSKKTNNNPKGSSLMRKQRQQNILKKKQRSPKQLQQSKKQFQYKTKQLNKQLKSRIQSIDDFYNMYSREKEIQLRGQRYVRMLNNWSASILTTNQSPGKLNQPIQYIYSKVTEITHQSIKALDTFIEKSRNQLKDNGGRQSSEIQQNEKKVQQLRSEIQQNTEKLIKTLFQYYYEVMVNVEVLLNEHLFYQKALHKMFPKVYETLDLSKTSCQITSDQALFPPVLCQNDLRMVYDSLTNKANFILNKEYDLYQTPKAEELVNLNIKLIDLAKCINLISNQLSKCSKLEKQLKVTSNRLNGFFRQKQYFSYETQSLLLMLDEYINQKLQKQKNSALQQRKQIDINGLRLFCFKQSMEFIQKLCFYNYIVSYNSCLTKRPIPYQIFLDLSPLKLTQLSYTDIKLRFLKLTMKWPDILKRLFNQSLSIKLIKPFMGNMDKRQFNIQNFYLYSYPIPSEQKMIQLLIKYQLHYSFFVIDLLAELSDNQNITLKHLYNCYRFILMFLIAHVTFRTINAIEREIKYCHGNWVHERVMQKRNIHAKWIDSNARLNSAIQISFQKINSYLTTFKQQNQQKSKSDNLTQINNFFKQDQEFLPWLNLLNLQYKNNIAQISQQLLHDTILKIYSHIFSIQSKVLFNQKQFSKICRKMSKKFGIKFNTFSQFISNRIQLIQANHLSKQQSKKKLQKFERQFKIVQIQILKIYNLSITLPFYSFAVELQDDRIHVLKSNKLKVMESHQQIFKNLQVLYISKRQLLNTKFLTRNDRTMGQINQILQQQTDMTLKLNVFFQRWNQQHNNGQISNLDDPKSIRLYTYPPVPIKKHCQIPKGKDTVSQILKQQRQTTDELMSQRTFDFRKTTAYKKTLNRGQNYNFDLNQVVDRQIHKNTVTNLNRNSSQIIKKLIVYNFLTDKDPTDKNPTDKNPTKFRCSMNNSSLKRNIQLIYGQNLKVKPPKKEKQGKQQLFIDDQKQSKSVYQKQIKSQLNKNESSSQMIVMKQQKSHESSKFTLQQNDAPSRPLSTQNSNIQ